MKLQGTRWMRSFIQEQTFLVLQVDWQPCLSGHHFKPGGQCGTYGAGQSDREMAHKVSGQGLSDTVIAGHVCPLASKALTRENDYIIWCQVQLI